MRHRTSNMTNVWLIVVILSLAFILGVLWKHAGTTQQAPQTQQSKQAEQPQPTATQFYEPKVAVSTFAADATTHRIATTINMFDIPPGFDNVLIYQHRQDSLSGQGSYYYLGMIPAKDGVYVLPNLDYACVEGQNLAFVLAKVADMSKLLPPSGDDLSPDTKDYRLYDMPSSTITLKVLGGTTIPCG